MCAWQAAVTVLKEQAILTGSTTLTNVTAAHTNAKADANADPTDANVTAAQQHAALHNAVHEGQGRHPSLPVLLTQKVTALMHA